MQGAGCYGFGNVKLVEHLTKVLVGDGEGAVAVIGESFGEDVHDV